MADELCRGGSRSREAVASSRSGGFLELGSRATAAAAAAAKLICTEEAKEKEKERAKVGKREKDRERHTCGTLNA